MTEFTSGKSKDLVTDNELAAIVELDDAFTSPDDPPSRSAEFLRIIMVLVFGNLRLCSLRPSSLYMLQAFDFLTAICVKLNLGGTRYNKREIHILSIHSKMNAKNENSEYFND